MIGGKRLVGSPQECNDQDSELYDSLYYGTNFRLRRASAPQFVYQKQYIAMNKRDVTDRVANIHAQQQTPRPSTGGCTKQWRQATQLPRVQSSTVYSRRRIQDELLQKFQRCSESVSPVRVQGRPVYSANVFHNNITRQTSARRSVEEQETERNEVPTNTKVRQLRTVQQVDIKDPEETPHAQLLQRIRCELVPRKQRLQLRNGVFHYQ